MKLEVGKTYIRKDFLYSAIVLSIVDDYVTYEFCNLHNGFKSKWNVNSVHFKNAYYPSTDLITALL